ncbi:uncharacterized protein BO80DRAFT_66022 [Aspergillus ibericus CBS 121593]|uniref:Uncharacterized protein n=1 Tax=Aspergillus ibericus CBS 121593 TaxID=1448316 RepID=A0A395H0J2_9EURO|nr:hypothetical protein BO80DRAFT_66022 [Aspergillus ibericus CBS 121593]RAL01341.1 hypothetical protein BO80DRAFT_66022 [Aspergillus ibericus CBS 121593]
MQIGPRSCRLRTRQIVLGKVTGVEPPGWPLGLHLGRSVHAQRGWVCGGNQSSWKVVSRQRASLLPDVISSCTVALCMAMAKAQNRDALAVWGSSANFRTGFIIQAFSLVDISLMHPGTHPLHWPVMAMTKLILLFFFFLCNIKLLGLNSGCSSHMRHEG